jgi:methylglutaconyl-CoA hydratase
MPYQYITATFDGSVARVSLNRPDVHNAFNDETIVELRQAFEAIASNAQIRAVILSGEGKSFCAGADLTWMRRMMAYTLEENQADAKALAEMLKVIADCPKPVIARIHGNAFGGGVGLISACDMAVAMEPCLFALTEVKLGLIPAVISPFVLQKIPVSAAQRYFLTGERFDTKTALGLGLLSDVVSSEAELDGWITARIEAILSNGPEAVSNAKRLIREVIGSEQEWPRVLDVTSCMIAERRASAEGQEGMTAFLEKRKPGWLSS